MGSLKALLLCGWSAALGVAAATAQDGTSPRALIAARDGVFRVDVPTGSNWCQPHVTLTVRARDADVFTGDVSVRVRLGAGIQVALPRECPRAVRATLNGFVDDVLVYRAVTLQLGPTEKWALLELPVAAVAKPPEPPSPLPEQALPMREPGPESVAKCDLEASHPSDPTKPFDVAGVGDEGMHAGRAVEACEEAIQFDPDNPRLIYQLARAYLMFDRPVEGIEMMTEAAEEGHGAAIAVIGDIVLYGLLGDEPDPALARSLYLKAAEAGFLPAAALGAAIQENPTEDTARSISDSRPHFSRENILKELLKGQPLLGGLEDRARAYVYGTYVTGGIMTHCPITGITLENLFDGLDGLPQAFKVAIIAARADSTLAQHGMDDGYALAFDRGCTAPEIQAVHDTLIQTKG